MSKPTERQEHLYELLKEFDTAMLITRGGDHGMHARPMRVAELRPGADAYFVTSIDSPKVAEIERDPDAVLTLQRSSRFAAAYGRVDVIRDRSLIERLWQEPWKAWFPDGKDDPSLAVLKLDAKEGEYWDSSGARGVRYALSAAAAYVQGEKPTTDEKQHARVRL